jgi:hypothetical protein
MESKQAIESADDDGRLRIYLDFSMWLSNECDAELERSISRESARMAEEEAERWLDSDDDDDVQLEEEDFAEILSELCEIDAIKEAASPEFVSAVKDVVSGKLKFELDLRFVGHDGIDVVASMSREAAVKLHAFSEAQGHRRLVDDFDRDILNMSTAEDWSEEFSVLLDSLIGSESAQMGIIDYMASLTDALCCDRLIDMKEFELRADTLRRKKREEEGRMIAESRRKRELN